MSAVAGDAAVGGDSAVAVDAGKRDGGAVSGIVKLTPIAPIGKLPRGSCIDVGDFNNDGKLDIAFAGGAYGGN